ncbi:myosin-11 [Octopus sinensis]|uniref:Myosin-11 n=1 Tax=Octopus sinensis TaxID=2607531 RepID=A0A6P7TU16_9MOLL|nr:myosin-11 [Octopus sinensis]
MNSTNSSQTRKRSAEKTVLNLASNDLLCSCCLRKQSEAPVEELLKKTSDAILKRRVNETREEIGKIMKRVDNIYGAYLQNQKDVQCLEDADVPSFKCITDIKQLEQILRDQVKKQQYQKQVTVFLVGYSELCNQKYRLLGELQEFFTNQNQQIWSPLLEEEEEGEEEEDEDEEEAEFEVGVEEVEGREKAVVSCDLIDNVTITQEHHVSLSRRLADIKRKMVRHLVMRAGALNDAATGGGGGGGKKTRNRKKVGKPSQQTKDISSLQYRIKQLTSDQEMKQRNLDDLMIQLENKDMECQRIQLESEGRTKELQEQIVQKDRLMSDLKQTVSHLCSKLTNSCFNNETNSNNNNNNSIASSRSIHSLLQENKDSMLDLSEKIQTKQLSYEEALTAAHTDHQSQLEKLQSVHQEEVECLQQEHSNSIEAMMESKTGHKDSSQKGTGAKKTKLTTTKQKSKGELKSSGKTSKTKDKDHTTTPSAQQTSRGGGASKEKSEGSGKASKSQSKQSKVVKATAAATAAASSSAAAVSVVTEMVFDQSVLESLDTFDLSDNESWGRLPVDQMPQRFSQYRWLTMKKLKELDEHLKLTTLRTQRKVESLKSQFQEHRFKWDEERELLHEQVKQLRHLQVTAEKEADNVMSQLEDFISEQEKMESEDMTNERNNILREPKTLMKDFQRISEGNLTSSTETDIRSDAVASMPHIQEGFSADEDDTNANMNNSNMDQPLTTPHSMPCDQAEGMEDVVTIATEETILSLSLPPPSLCSLDMAESADQRQKNLTDGQRPVREMREFVDCGISCKLEAEISEFNSIEEVSLPDVPVIPDAADVRDVGVPIWLTKMVGILTNYKKKMETFLKLQDIDSANDLLSDLDPKASDQKAVTEKLAEDMTLTAEKFLSGKIFT